LLLTIVKATGLSSLEIAVGILNATARELRVLIKRKHVETRQDESALTAATYMAMMNPLAGQLLPMLSCIMPSV